MHLLYQLLADSPRALQVVYLLSLALTVWMLVDAYRRGADFFWYWVIFFLQPFGALAYFVVVKRHDLRLPRGLALWSSGPSLAELRYQAERFPTLTNHLALAERLIEDGDDAGAVPHLSAALKIEQEHPRVAYLLAVCHVHQGNFAEALPLLMQLLKREPRWSHGIAWRLLGEARGQAGDEAGSLAAWREFVRLAPVLENQCLLADRLLNAGQAGEARELLHRALGDHSFAPLRVRLREWRWASEARRLLQEAEQPGVREKR
jgi:hypothetical protein